jgi:hypothetical protein
MEPEGQPTLPDQAEQLLEGTAEAPTSAGNYAHASLETPYAWATSDVGYYLPSERNRFTSGLMKLAAAALAAVAGAVAVGVMFLQYDRRTHNTLAPPPPVTVTASPSVAYTASAQPPTAPPDVQREQTPDERYLKLFSEMTTLEVTDPVPVIAMGHAQCDFLSIPGNTPGMAAAAITSEYTKMTRQMSYGAVEAAVNVYCPQYKYEL